MRSCDGMSAAAITITMACAGFRWVFLKSSDIHESVVCTILPKTLGMIGWTLPFCGFLLTFVGNGGFVRDVSVL